MRADRFGTPTEQARHACGWASATERAAAVAAGTLPAGQTCGTCQHLGVAQGGRRARYSGAGRTCSRLPHTWATSTGACCRHWTERGPA